MNKNQKKIFGLYILSLILIGLFLPYLLETPFEYVEEGYYFVLAPPEAEGLSGVVSKYVVDVERVVLEIVIATVIMVVLMAVFKKR